MTGKQPLSLLRVASDVDVMQSGIGNKVGSATQYVSQFFIGIILAFVFWWRLSLVVLCCDPFLSICGVFFSRLVVDSSNDSQGAYGKFQVWLLLMNVFLDESDTEAALLCFRRCRCRRK